jgi:hypothetical protein
MNKSFIKKMIIVLISAGFLLTAVTTQAYPPFLRQAAKFGAKDCTFCHLKPSGGEGWNERGKWLRAEKAKRQADVVDVEWLKDYQAAKATTESHDEHAEHAEHGHERHGENDGDKWPEMDAFHDVMSQTLHPAEAGDLAPIRKRAAEVAQKASAWAESQAPKIYATEVIKEKVGRIAVESKALADLIERKGSDEEVKKSATALHKLFHEISNACRAEQEKQRR